MDYVQYVTYVNIVVCVFVCVTYSLKFMNMSLIYDLYYVTYIYSMKRLLGYILIDFLQYVTSRS